MVAVSTQLPGEQMTERSSYVYDDAGHRTSQTTGSVRTDYLMADVNPTGYSKPVEEMSSAGGGGEGGRRSYILGDRVLGQHTNSDGIDYLVADGHGSTRALVDASGVTVRTMSYDAFGNALDFDPQTVDTPWLFGGDGMYDAASGVYWHGNGVRARQDFRFLQMDTYAGSTSDPISLHKYLYANANPISYSDPSGNFSVIDTMYYVGCRMAFESMSAATRYAPAIATATTVAGAVFLVSTIEQALEQTGFLPQNQYMTYVWAISGAVFTAGQTLQSLSMRTVQITSPLSGSRNGELISGKEANLRAIASNPSYGKSPPYIPNSLAAQGTISPGTQLVRLYNPTANSPMVGKWVALRSEVIGLTPTQLQEKYALPNLPTYIVDVDGIGVAARVGFAKDNFVGNGGGVQIELLGKGASFVNERPINGVAR